MVAFELWGCNKSTEPDEVKPYYPFAAGDTWNYLVEVSFLNFHPIVPGATFPDTIMRWTSRVECIGRDTLRGGIVTWKVHVLDTLGSGDHYYTSRSDTLLLYAYRGGGSSVFPKQASHYQFHYQGRIYNSIQEICSSFTTDGLMNSITAPSDTTFLSPPYKVLISPLRIGLEWIYLEDAISHFRIEKKVVASELLTVPAGTFLVYKIQWWNIYGSGTVDTSLVSYDYVNSRGLIKRGFYYSNIMITTPAYPEGVGYADMKSECELTSSRIN